MRKILMCVVCILAVASAQAEPWFSEKSFEMPFILTPYGGKVECTGTHATEVNCSGKYEGNVRRASCEVAIVNGPRLRANLQVIRIPANPSAREVSPLLLTHPSGITCSVIPPLGVTYACDRKNEDKLGCVICIFFLFCFELEGSIYRFPP